MQKAFIQKFKMEKLLAKSKAEQLKKGDKYSMFSSVYEICTESAMGEIILKDQYENKIAVSSSKFKQLVKSGIAEKTTMSKAAPQFTGDPTAPKPKLSSAADKKLSAGAALRGAPVGTIHNGRQKVSADPSKWVELHTGHSYDQHNSPDKQSTRHPDAVAQVKDFMGKIANKVAKADLPRLEEHLHQYLDAKQKSDNIMQAGNRSQGTDQQAKVPSVHEFHDKAQKIRSEFIQAVKNSIARKKDGK